MKNNKNTINQALDRLSISRASLYNHLKRLEITPIKEGRRVYLLDNQIDDIQAFLLSNLSNLDKPVRQVGQVRHVKEDKKKENTAEKIYKKQAEEFKKALGKEQAKNEALQEKIINLSQEVGRWEGVANTLKDQNQKLLEVKTEPESEIVEAEIIEPKSAPKEKAEKRGFFQKLFNFKK